jgi:hypothetical protein
MVSKEQIMLTRCVEKNINILHYTSIFACCRYFIATTTTTTTTTATRVTHDLLGHTHEFHGCGI